MDNKELVKQINREYRARYIDKIKRRLLAKGIDLTKQKTCKDCLASKPLADFDVQWSQPDGFRKRCKVCFTRYYQNYYQKNKERLNAKTSVYAKKHPEAIKKSILKYPEKNKARKILQNAVRKGQIEKLVCIKCGGKSEAHHPDYSKPLDVLWLCRKHHAEEHLKYV